MKILDELMGEYGFSVPTAAYRKLQEQLAARQPVGEPVAVVSQETYNDNGTSDIIKPALPIGTPLYTAPPAVVGLEQFRDAVYWAASLVTPKAPAHFRRDFANLLALIDSKAVRNG